MILYKTKLNCYPALRIFWNTNDKFNFFKRFFKFKWVTGSLLQFDTLLASWYPTYVQSFIISHSSSYDEQYLTHCWHHGTRHTCKVSLSAIHHHATSNMATCLRTHILTHTQLNHQRLMSDKSAIPVNKKLYVVYILLT